MRKLSLLLFFALCAVAGTTEPSAFGAGNLDSKNPYGLSQDEQHILKNKRAVEIIQKRLIKQEQMLQTHDERISGLQTVLEGLLHKIQNNAKALKQLDDLNQSIDSLQTQSKILAQTQNENFEQIRSVLKELGSMIDSINEKYVDKDRFKKLESAFLQFKTSYDSYRKKGQLGRKSNATIYKEAKMNFRKGLFDNAKTYFSYLIKKRYKPATSNYYLGEIAYKRANYKDAIAHYKKSASLYDKSSFMPVLLLHTAISLQRIGDKKQAKRFYNSLIQLYPKSKSASIAKKYMK